MSRGLIACVFPGQGSQRKGMGADLFDHFPAQCAAADQILGYSLRQLCLEDPRRELRFTAFTQPALFVVNALSWLRRQQDQPPPQFLAGHSLGEYNALFAAGCFDFETGLRLVQRRGEIMGRVQDGGMAAVLGLPAELVQGVLEQQGVAVDIANINLAHQLVLSGAKEDLEQLFQPLEKAGARKCILLNVSGAFHSRHMASAAAEFECFLKGFAFAEPNIEVIANVTAQPYTTNSTVSNLAAQIRSPVRWAQIMSYLRLQGVDELQELGPGKVLRKLWATALEEEAPVLCLNREAERVSDEDAPGTAEGAGSPQPLGDPAFRHQYGLRHAYVASAPVAGVRTPEFVINLGQKGFLSFLDLAPEEDPVLPGVEAAIQQISRALAGPGVSFGLSLRPAAADSCHGTPNSEEQLVAIALKHNLQVAEAVGYRRLTAPLVRFRFSGACCNGHGQPVARRQLLAQVTDRRTAALFLDPAPEKLVIGLVSRGELTAEEGEIARLLPMSGDLCTMTGTAEGGDLITLLPAIQRLRDQLSGQYPGEPIRVGAGGALGTPEALACAFLLGADFVLTGAINMSSAEVALPQFIKEILFQLTAGETCAVPAADGFELGARTQVLKRGTLFAARATKLYHLFRFHDSLESLDPELRKKLETSYFKRTIASIRDRLANNGGPKQQMAQVFGWYLRQSLRWAVEGDLANKLNYQIPCDESLAAFNLYAATSQLADPAQRTVAAIAETLMAAAATFVGQQVYRYKGLESPTNLDRVVVVQLDLGVDNVHTARDGTVLGLPDVATGGLEDLL